MFQEIWSTVRAFFRNTAGSLYHIVVVALSAGIALLLPAGAKQFLSFWSRVEHDLLSLIAVEMTVAILLIACLNYFHRSIRDRALAAVAAGAGLVSFFPRRTRGAQRHIKQLKEEQGTGRTISVNDKSNPSFALGPVSIDAQKHVPPGSVQFTARRKTFSRWCL